MPHVRLQENPEAYRLWTLPEQEFNAWRRANDLPRLLAFLKEALPHFVEWLRTHSIGDEDFIAVDHTSRLLLGERTRYIIDVTEQRYSIERERRTSVSDVSDEQIRAGLLRAFGSMGTTEIHSAKSFEPYFMWLSRAKRIKYFRIVNDINRGFADDIAYMSWHGGDLGTSVAHLFYTHAVLKLGGTNIPAQFLDERNLDFVDLDGLVVSGKAWGRTTSVAYASCRDIAFQDVEKPFLTFEKCALENLAITNCNLFDLTFRNCVLRDAAVKDSRLRKVAFDGTFPGGIRPDNCELEDLTIVNTPADVTFAQKSAAYKRLRFAFQQRGNRIEASQYYYLERLNELWAAVWPIVPDLPAFPGRSLRGLRDLYKRWRDGQYDRRALRFIFAQAVRRYTALLRPTLFWSWFKVKVRGIRQVIDWAVWGFGERPSRVFVWMIAVLAAFAARYYFSAHPKLRGNLAESVYCSAFNFATMGCDYKSSVDSIEGLLGATLLAIMVAGFSNKTRY